MGPSTEASQYPVWHLNSFELHPFGTWMSAAPVFSAR
jgi:hypothetical protein